MYLFYITKALDFPKMIEKDLKISSIDLIFLK